MTKRNQQHAWDALRSQIMERMRRPNQNPQQADIEPRARPAFRLDYAEPYYGPTREAREEINRLLGLAAGCRPEYWDAELGRAGKMDALVEALGDPALDCEARSAVALVLLERLDRDVGRSGATELLARLRWHLRRNAQVQARMRYWWTHMDGSPQVMEALG